MSLDFLSRGATGSASDIASCTLGCTCFMWIQKVPILKTRLSQMTHQSTWWRWPCHMWVQVLTLEECSSWQCLHLHGLTTLPSLLVEQAAINSLGMPVKKIKRMRIEVKLNMNYFGIVANWEPKMNSCRIVWNQFHTRLFIIWARNHFSIWWGFNTPFSKFTFGSSEGSRVASSQGCWCYTNIIVIHLSKEGLIPYEVAFL